MRDCRQGVIAAMALAWTLSASGVVGSAQDKSSGSNQNIAAKSLLSDSGPTFVVPVKEIPKRWTVIAYGDTRFTDPANTQVTNPKVREWLVQRIASEHPDALLISGDLPYDGSNAADYEVFKTETEAWRTEKLRVYPSLGNHELAHDAVKGLRNWWTAFPQLEERRWYSVDFGNAYIVVLDSNLPLAVGSVQQVWLADQLAHLPKQIRFVMVELHHPPVADSTPPQTHLVGPNEAALAKFLEALAPSMKAKMVVVAGHTHNYERFEEGGIVYLVSGGGGAKPYVVPRDANDLYKNPSLVNYHYIKFVFDGQKLNATMYRVNDNAATPVFEAKDGFSVVAAP